MDKLLMHHVFENMEDGMVYITADGTLSYLNPSAHRLYGVGDEYTGGSFRNLFEREKENDDFHEFILNAIYDKEKPHKGLVAFKHANGDVRYLMVNSSYFVDPNNSEENGIILLASDITEKHRLNMLRDDSSKMFTIIMMIVCLWVFMNVMLSFIGININDHIETWIVVSATIISCASVLPGTSMLTGDVGLNTVNLKHNILVNLAISCTIMAGMVIFKYAAIQLDLGIYPEGTPMIHWDNFGVAQLLYPFSVLLQEFVSRGVLHESLLRMLTGKHKRAWAIVLSSLLFGTVHIHMGFAYMAYSFLLLLFFGIIYDRQKNIWGVCVTHYILGIGYTMLGFIPA